MTTDAPPARRVVAAFDIPIPTVKPLTPNSRVHFHERARVAKLLRETAWAYALKAHPQGVPKVTHRRHLHLMLWRGRGDRALDDDNLAAALKPIRDGIVDAGLLVDDAPQWCTGTVSQARAKDGRRRVAVVLYEGADG